MREKLNSNPTVQIALVGILLVAAGFMLLTQMGGGGGSGSTATTPATADTATTPATATPATAGATTTPSATTDPAAAASTTTSAAPIAGIPASAASAIPAPPLPAAVTRAYASSKTVVLLVVRDGGIDDRFVAQAVRSLAPVQGVSVFVTAAKHIARYSAITLGVDVERVPALIVMRPRRLSDGTPKATVSYGFQSPQSVVQAVLDASYNGPTQTYHPN